MAASIGITALLGLAAAVATWAWDGRNADSTLSYEHAFDYAMSAAETNWEKRNTAMMRITADLYLAADELHKVAASGSAKKEAEALLGDLRGWLRPRKGRQLWTRPKGQMEKIRVALISPLSSLEERRQAIADLRVSAEQGLNLIHDAVAAGGRQGAQAQKALRLIRRSVR